MFSKILTGRVRRVGIAALFAASCMVTTASAQVTAFKQAIAEAASKDRDIAAFYQANGYQALWTTANAARRNALLTAISDADLHGLPVARYDAAGLRAKLAAATSAQERGRVEVEMSRVFLDLAQSMQTGVLTPRKVDNKIVRVVPLRDRASYLTSFEKSSPAGFFRSLPPKTGEYARLLKSKQVLERQRAAGGWGAPVPAASLKPGAQGAAVVALRNRLMAMGYLDRSNGQSYDATMQKAVQLFQIHSGLEPDGVAGEGTMKELNRSIDERLRAVVVAMERERWFNMERGERHILVNITDFTAKIVDHDQVTFETRSVVGANKEGQQTPEFSDVMEFMVINPTWNVPRSITVKEYLPMLQRNPNAVGHLRITDARGNVVNRSAINFASYNERNFPFDMKQPPSDGNALGLVKFMFPNQYNIYLHDTPAKNLFSHEVRAYSHGCIRLGQPFDFAYALLAKQTKDPVGFFKARLATKLENSVMLEKPVPVHLIYRTAFTDAKGGLHFRRDIYGRDAKIWQALENAGVALGGERG